jgi:hypothetical protein
MLELKVVSHTVSLNILEKLNSARLSGQRKEFSCFFIREEEQGETGVFNRNVLEM